MNCVNNIALILPLKFFFLNFYPLKLDLFGIGLGVFLQLTSCWVIVMLKKNVDAQFDKIQFDFIDFKQLNF